MPGARFEPDTPQLHILGVKKRKETRQDLPHFSHSLDYFRVCFLGRLFQKYSGHHVYRISVCLILWGFLKNTVYSNHCHTL